MFISLAKIILHVIGMTYFLVNTISATANAYLIIQKDVRYLVNKLTHNIYILVSLFLWRGLR